MKFTLLSFLFLLVVALPSIAQDRDEDEKDWDRPMKTKVGGAGGVTPIVAFLDNTELDKSLKASGLPTIGSDPIYLVGGEGYGYIMFLKNVRLGGFGAGGSKTITAIENVSSGTLKKEVEYSVSYGGVLIDYVIPAAEKLDIALGFSIGGGGVNIRMTRDNNSIKVWNDVWKDFADTSKTTGNYTRNLNGSFGAFNPHVNVEYALLRWLQLRIGVGYPIMYSPEWKLDNNFSLEGVPSKMKASGYTINAGIMFGFFN